ncbi:MAG: hypothetical protein WDN72_01875 [Alphaproteobacteria bacterium]
MPGNIEALRALPGIGRNTAHAVMAFAHHAPVAILEANVKRVVETRRRPHLRPRNAGRGRALGRCGGAAQ